MLLDNQFVLSKTSENRQSKTKTCIDYKIKNMTSKKQKGYANYIRFDCDRQTVKFAKTSIALQKLLAKKQKQLYPNKFEIEKACFKSSRE